VSPVNAHLAKNAQIPPAFYSASMEELIEAMTGGPHF